MGLVPVHRIDISTLNTRKNFLHNIVIREIHGRQESGGVETGKRDVNTSTHGIMGRRFPDGGLQRYRK